MTNEVKLIPFWNACSQYKIVPIIEEFRKKENRTGWNNKSLNLRIQEAMSVGEENSVLVKIPLNEYQVILVILYDLIVAGYPMYLLYLPTNVAIYIMLNEHDTKGNDNTSVLYNFGNNMRMGGKLLMLGSLYKDFCEDKNIVK